MSGPGLRSAITPRTCAASATASAMEGDLGDWLAGDKVKLAVNGAVLADKTALKAGDGDEVALLPPVSGG